MVSEKEVDYINWVADKYYSCTLDEFRYLPLTGGQVAAISGLPYIGLSDMRYMTAGVSEEYSRLDEGGLYFPYTGRCVVEGTLRRMKLIKPLSDSFSSDYGSNFLSNRLILDNCIILAGDCAYVDQAIEGSIEIWAHLAKQNRITKSGWNWTGRYCFYIKPGYIYNNEYIETLTPGQRYIFILHFDPLLIVHDWNDKETKNTAERIDYLETDKFAALAA